MSKHTFSVRAALAVAALALSISTVASAANPFVGNWALTIPGGGAGWLGVTEEGGALKGGILWGGGSVVPVQGVAVEGDKLIVTRIQQPRGVKGKPAPKKILETITATRDGDNLKLVTVKRNEDGKELGRAEFAGKRIPPLPPAPGLAKVKFGEPIVLFNGKDLAGWKPMGDNSGWNVKDGVLDNHAPQEEGKPHKRYANLRTEREFEDFNLKLEVCVPKNGNSGIYLRGIYEVQVADTSGKPLDSHNMGGIYSRITPAVAAEKPAGEWQTFDITLVDRHVTVIVNGKTIIANQPLLGCTGGALTSDEFRPGPIYLQGDHTSVQYRNIVLRPVVK
ncbi:MAG: DUF1080 domain-containing protein [Verrucomicrobia bacterium]|nr:DUF1080 domain-containing protein [Verrucomicrobiota bacterium]